MPIVDGKTSPAGQRWIEVPETFHDDPHELRGWAARAHELALSEPLPKRRKKRKVRRA